MATRQPFGQTRNQNGRDWGNYASLTACPNGSTWAGADTDSLEAGDTAYVTGTGRVHCTSAGTPGALDAVWVATGGATSRTIDLVFQGVCEGTAPVVVGAVYLLNGDSIDATSNALVGTAAGGTGTVQLRRQGTGALLGGASWAYTGTGVSNDALAASVSVVANDWYTIEVVGDAGATIALAYGLRLVVT